MTKQRFFRPIPALMLFVFFQMILSFQTIAQEKPLEPELSVAGIKLGDRASAKTFLNGYSPRTDEGRPTFYFYNGYATQVMKLTGRSFEDPYFITEIEVFNVNESYQKKHFQAKKIDYFTTEKGIFIGYRQSVASILLFPGVSRNEIIGPKDVVKKKGEPTERIKAEDREIVIYQLAGVELPADGKTSVFDYFAKYEFFKNKLRRFSIKISEPGEKTETPQVEVSARD
jgi:hypothetical protein